jgi:hypothetical protein
MSVAKFRLASEGDRRERFKAEDLSGWPTSWESQRAVLPACPRLGRASEEHSGIKRFWTA